MKIIPEFLSINHRSRPIPATWPQPSLRAICVQNSGIIRLGRGTKPNKKLPDLNPVLLALL
jgi:hypothetical protein